MSLQSLPTELDVRIIKFLGRNQQALSRLSKVPKYYRDLTERHLYENIVLNFHDFSRLVFLSRTVAIRPSLALHVRFLNMTAHASGQPPQAVSDYYTNKILQYSLSGGQLVRLIQARISQIVNGEPASGAKAELLHNMHCKEITGYLALILCAAKNLEHLQICRAHGPIIQVLEFPWRITGTQPFSKLKFLECCACGTESSLLHVILPSMEELIISNWRFLIPLSTRFAPTFDAPMIGTSIPILHTIQFRGVYIGPAFLGQLVKSPWLISLKHLQVTHCHCTPSEPPVWWNMPALLRSLEVAIPQLEIFEWWTYDWMPLIVRAFDTFTRLRRLKHIGIAFDTMVRRGNFSPSGVLDPQTFLPEDLESLTIHDIRIQIFESVLLSIRQHNEQARDKRTALVDLIKTVAAKASKLQRLELTVKMERMNPNEPDGVGLFEFSGIAIVSIHNIADVLLKLGVQLSVLRAPGRYDRDLKLLMKAGYTAPLPHSSRLGRGGK